MAKSKFRDPWRDDPNAPSTPAFQSIPGRTPSLGGGSSTPTAPPSPGELPTIPKSLSAEEFIQRREKLESIFSGGGPVTGFVREQAAARLRAEINSRQRQITVGEANAALQGIDSAQAGAGNDLSSKSEAGGGVSSGVSGFFEANSVAETNKIIVEQTGEAITIAAKATDVLRTAVLGKKPLQAQQLEETFEQLTKSLTADVQDITLGFQDPASVERRYQMAVDAVNAYESFNKKEGKINLRYQVTQGMETQAQAIVMREILLDIRNDLDQAKITWRQQRIQAAAVALGGGFQTQ